MFPRILFVIVLAASAVSICQANAAVPSTRAFSARVFGGPPPAVPGLRVILIHADFPHAPRARGLPAAAPGHRWLETVWLFQNLGQRPVRVHRPRGASPGVSTRAYPPGAMNTASILPAGRSLRRHWYFQVRRDARAVWLVYPRNNETMWYHVLLMRAMTR